jgi:holo-[acyl-carrier protein] synthase
MKQAYIGTDIIEISRIDDAIKHWGNHFLRRIYTDKELSLFGSSLESLAVRFAGKEAAIKALSVPENNLSWKEIEILSEPNGRPEVVLHGQARVQAQGFGLDRLEISLSHSRENAIAFVVGIPN